MRTSIPKLLAAAVLTMSTVILPAAGAHAAGLSCYAKTCNGQDPQNYGCAGDARTVRSVAEFGYTVELRFSAKCMAAWARIPSGAYPGAYMEAHNDVGNIVSFNVPPGYSSGWSDMVNDDSGILAYACNGDMCTYPGY